jgi:hypothetical protein
MLRMDEEKRPELPASLRAVAYFTLLCGIGTLLTMIVDLTHKRLSVNLGVLEIPAGFGILRLSRGWRTFTLLGLWFGMVGFAIAILVLLFGGHTSDLKLFGQPVNQWGRPMLVAISVMALGVMIWQYRVLTSPAVRRLFGLTSGPAEPPGGPGTGAGPGGSFSGPLPGT